jgi:hypothetical protein
MTILLAFCWFVLFLLIMFVAIVFLDYLGACMATRHKHKWDQWKRIDVWRCDIGIIVLFKKECSECGLVKYKKIKI